MPSSVGLERLLESFRGAEHTDSLVGFLNTATRNAPPGAPRYKCISFGNLSPVHSLPTGGQRRALDYLVVALVSGDFQSVSLSERFDFRHRGSFSSPMEVLDKLWTIDATHAPNATRKHPRFNVKSKGCVRAV